MAYRPQIKNNDGTIADIPLDAETLKGYSVSELLGCGCYYSKDTTYNVDIDGEYNVYLNDIYPYNNENSSIVKVNDLILNSKGLLSVVTQLITVDYGLHKAAKVNVLKKTQSPGYYYSSTAATSFPYDIPLNKITIPEGCFIRKGDIIETLSGCLVQATSNQSGNSVTCNKLRNVNAVTSVNGQVGGVVLTASDVGALASNGTAADSSKLGGTAASQYIQKSNTSGLIKNDGSVDTTSYSTFTGYNSSNKLSTDYINNVAGWTSNAGTVTSVNNVTPTNGNVSLTIPTLAGSGSATTAAKSDHTHTLSLASGGTSTVDLAANTAYTLTAGGNSLVFKTPAGGGGGNKIIPATCAGNGTSSSTTRDIVFTDTLNDGDILAVTFTSAYNGKYSYLNVTLNGSSETYSLYFQYKNYLMEIKSSGSKFTGIDYMPSGSLEVLPLYLLYRNNKLIILNAPGAHVDDYSTTVDVYISKYLTYHYLLLYLRPVVRSQLRMGYLLAGQTATFTIGSISSYNGGDRTLVTFGRMGVILTNSVSTSPSGNMNLDVKAFYKGENPSIINDYYLKQGDRVTICNTGNEWVVIDIKPTQLTEVSWSSSTDSTTKGLVAQLSEKGRQIWWKNTSQDQPIYIPCIPHVSTSIDSDENQVYTEKLFYLNSSGNHVTVPDNSTICFWHI